MLNKPEGEVNRYTKDSILLYQPQQKKRIIKQKQLNICILSRLVCKQVDTYQHFPYFHIKNIAPKQFRPKKCPKEGKFRVPPFLRARARWHLQSNFDEKNF